MHPVLILLGHTADRWSCSPASVPGSLHITRAALSQLQNPALAVTEFMQLMIAQTFNLPRSQKSFSTLWEISRSFHLSINCKPTDRTFKFWKHYRELFLKWRRVTQLVTGHQLTLLHWLWCLQVCFSHIFLLYSCRCSCAALFPFLNLIS